MVTRARQRVAFLLDDTFSPDTTGNLVDDPFEPLDPFGPNPTLLADPGKEGLGAAALALLLLFQMQQGERESLGAGSADVPVLAMRAWEYNGKPIASPISQSVLSMEQVRQHCRRLRDVQGWANEAARMFESERQILGPSNHGIKIHTWMKHHIDELHLMGAYGDLLAEFSISGDEEVYYGKRGSTRLDILEDRTTESGFVCVYDVKTGNSGFGPTRLNEIGASVLKYFGPVRFIIIEVRPLL